MFLHLNFIVFPCFDTVNIVARDTPFSDFFLKLSKNGNFYFKYIKLNYEFNNKYNTIIAKNNSTNTKRIKTHKKK